MKVDELEATRIALLREWRDQELEEIEITSADDAALVIRCANHIVELVVEWGWPVHRDADGRLQARKPRKH